MSMFIYDFKHNSSWPISSVILFFCFDSMSFPWSHKFEKKKKTIYSVSQEFLLLQVKRDENLSRCLLWMIDLKNVEKGPSSALLSALDIVAIAGHYSFLFKASREEAAGQGCWPEASGSEGLVEGRSARQGETMFSTLPQVRRVGQRMATLSV